MDFDLTVNGLPVKASYDEALLRSLLTRMKAMKRGIVFIAAPPGAGKSTLATALEKLGNTMEGPSVQALGMDGFHHTAAYIADHTVCRDGETVPMASVKGAPESFDLEKLAAALKNVRDRKWPIYDRRLHDVVEDAIDVTGDILIIEGNYLLLDEDGWRDLTCDLSVFVTIHRDLCIRRLIDRKVAGGMERSAAERFVRASDLRNADRILKNRKPSHITLQVTAEGKLLRAD
ncbi:MAG: nucleoside/nucleotide kinase family protein [Clostridia bacterium]|nr:nucleoside/nucleotide kinase family protein [Clostridia bacterium]